MDKKNMRWVLNRITNSRYVNLHFKGVKNAGAKVKEFLGEFTDGKYTNNYCINVDISTLVGDDKGKKMADIINRKMVEIHFPFCIRDSHSMEHTLEQFENWLNQVNHAVLFIFHYFKDQENKEETNILTSLRILIGDINPINVQIVILSDVETEHWDLAPYSLLDDRFVEYIPWNGLQ